MAWEINRNELAASGVISWWRQLHEFRFKFNQLVIGTKHLFNIPLPLDRNPSALSGVGSMNISFARFVIFKSIVSCLRLFAGSEASDVSASASQLAARRFGNGFELATPVRPQSLYLVTIFLNYQLNALTSSLQIKWCWSLKTNQNFAAVLSCADSSRISSNFLAEYTLSRFVRLTSLTMSCFPNCQMGRITCVVS